MPDVSRHLTDSAIRSPKRTAVTLAKNRKAISYEQLEAECDRMAAHFSHLGVRAGMRVALFVRPGLEFVPAVFGCFRIGAIPVFIDPGMRLKNVLACVAKAGPHAVIGGRPALILARLFPRPFATATLRIRLPKVLPGKFSRVAKNPHVVKETDTAAILFTSGSTGVPKGVVYTHQAFDHQQRLLRATYSIADDEIDLVVFPLFALFAAAWGISAVIPKMNPAKPAGVSGKHLAKVIRKFGVTHTAGSPAIWKQLSDHCLSRSILLPSLRRILMAGAQVPEKLVRSCARLAREVHTPYGATEALPLTTVSQTELFDAYPLTKKGGGTYVGHPLPGVDIAILPLTETSAEAQWHDSLRQAPYQKGEITVKAAWVTTSYFGDSAATEQAKLKAGSVVWHRMGDVGYLDAEGALWFCGRKDHRIFSKNGVYYPDPIEAIFNGQPGIAKCALVGLGKKGEQRPVLVVQRQGNVPSLKADLLALAKKLPLTEGITDVIFKSVLPLDVRHNIKIDRPLLAQQIEKGLA